MPSLSKQSFVLISEVNEAVIDGKSWHKSHPRFKSRAAVKDVSEIAYAIQLFSPSLNAVKKLNQQKLCINNKTRIP